MKVTTGRPRFSAPDRCYVLATAPTLGVLATALKLDLDDLRGREQVELRRADIVLIEEAAVQPSDKAWLEELAKLALGLDVLLVVFSRTAESPGEVIAALTAKGFGTSVEEAEPDVARAGEFRTAPHSSLFEYQAAIWPDIDPRLNDELGKAHLAMNLRRIRNGSVNLGSVYYGLGALLFGPPGALVVLLVTVATLLGTPVGSWHYVAWFIAAPAFAMALFMPLNPLQQANILMATYLALDAAHRGFDLLAVALVAALSILSFWLWFRARESMDVHDLLRCVFDRDIVATNPNLAPGEKPEIGSGQFILWRLAHLEAFRLFDAQSLSRVFISHRNSPDGIRLAHLLHEYLDGVSWSVYLERHSLFGGSWRGQLTDGLYGQGLMLVVLTDEPRESMFWVRRELFAACLKYLSYGNPIPIIVEHGTTLDELIAAETAAGHLNTPLHRAQQRLLRVPWRAGQADAENLAAAEQAMREAVRRTLERQVPVFLSSGLQGIAAQFFYPAIAVLAAGTLWLDAGNGLHASLIGLALLILFTDAGGYAVARILPRWAGGVESRRGWYRRVGRAGQPGRLLAVLTLSFVILAGAGWDWRLLTATLVGIVLNLLDHALWETTRLRARFAEASPAAPAAPEDSADPVGRDAPADTTATLPSPRGDD